MNRLHYKFATLAILALSASFPAAMAVSYDNTADQSSPSPIADAAPAEPQTKEEKKEEKKEQKKEEKPKIKRIKLGKKRARTIRKISRIWVQTRIRRHVAAGLIRERIQKSLCYVYTGSV